MQPASWVWLKDALWTDWSQSLSIPVSVICFSVLLLLLLQLLIMVMSRTPPASVGLLLLLQHGSGSL